MFPDGTDWFKANWVFRQLAQDVCDRYSSDAEICEAVRVAEGLGALDLKRMNDGLRRRVMDALTAVAMDTIRGSIAGWRPHDAKGHSRYRESVSELAKCLKAQDNIGASPLMPAHKNHSRLTRPWFPPSRKKQGWGTRLRRTARECLRYDLQKVISQLQTPRLLLRPLMLADAQQTQLLFPHWEIVRYLSNVVPWPYPPDGAYTHYRDAALPAMERGDAWHWTLRLKNDPEQLIGSINLRKGEDTNRGFWLGLTWHGQGLMTEACEAVTDFWFNTLKFPVLRVTKAVANVASSRISEKGGMRIVAEEERDYVSGRLRAEIWEITAEEWNARGKRKIE